MLDDHYQSMEAGRNNAAESNGCLPASWAGKFTGCVTIATILVTVILMAALIKNSSNADNRPFFGFNDQFNSSLGPKYSSVLVCCGEDVVLCSAFASLQWVPHDDSYSAFESGDLVQYRLVNASAADPGHRVLLGQCCMVCNLFAFSSALQHAAL